MPKTPHIEDFCEDRARSGEGQYAIAFGLLQIARAHEKVATALNRLGTGNASTEQGAIELLAQEVKSVAESITLLGNQLQP